MGETSSYNIKSIITHSILHKPIMECRAKLSAWRINKTALTCEGETIYIVSPYKTGTTYIGSLWNESIAKHEPFQLYSLRDMKRNFRENFLKRELLLDIKLECSGFFSLFLDKLPESNMPYKYVYILRPPSKWVTSVIKHFYGLRTIGYNYINEYYWKRLLSYDMLSVLNRGNQKEIQKLTDDLYGIYFRLLHDAENCQQIYFVELKNVDQFALKLGKRLGTRPNFGNAWKREAKYKPDFHIPELPAMDEKFEKFLKTLPKGRFFPL